MAIELQAADKKSIVEQHLKAVSLSKYNVELSLLEANSLTDKNQGSIDALNIQLIELQAQYDALNTEYQSVLAAIENPS